MSMPRLTGRTLTAARLAAETPGSDAGMHEILKRSLGLHLLPKLPAMWRGELPIDAKPLAARSPRRWSDAVLSPPPVRSWPHPSAAFARAYRDGAPDPRAIAERAIAELAALGQRRPTMNLLVAADDARALRDADASRARFAKGAPIGPLDGVPFLVKDEFDVEGLPTRLGSRCEPVAPAERDSTVVARLRRSGAIMIGKTVLTEWGMSPIGANPSFEMPHNAHDPSRAPGGSSTGSGVGVALGVAPIAAGGDGGGSIRIPACLNGVFGIKPTFGRVSRAGDGFKGSVAHAGPIGSSTADLVAFLDAVASEVDPGDALTAWAPPPPEGGFGASLGLGVRGLRVGVDEEDWRGASEPVAAACREALRGLERDGAVIVPVSMPIAKHATRIGYLTIGPESLASHRSDWIEQRALINDDVRLAFAVLSGFSALEQLDAQRLRTGLRVELARVLRAVDVIALPTTAITAPRYTEEDARACFSDPDALDGLCRFAFVGNLTGLPAATAPVGLDPGGLPIGLQIIGDAWDEASVLAVLAHLERAEIAIARKPGGAVDLFKLG